MKMTSAEETRGLGGKNGKLSAKIARPVRDWKLLKNIKKGQLL